VARVERGGVDHEDRHRRPSAGVVGHRPEPGRFAGRGDDELTHLDRRRPLARPVAEERAVPGRTVEDRVVQLADPVATRVVATGHSEVLAEVRERSRTNVLLDAGEEARLDVRDDVRVIVVGDLGVGFRREQLADVEVVERADDRPARHGREHLDAAKDSHLRDAREHADVKERRAEAAPGEGETEAGRGRHGSW
jgi:hypothetical protein